MKTEEVQEVIDWYQRLLECMLEVVCRWIPFEQAMPPNGRLLLVKGDNPEPIFLVKDVCGSLDDEIYAFAEPGGMRARFLTHWRLALPEIKLPRAEDL